MLFNIPAIRFVKTARQTSRYLTVTLIVGGHGDVHDGLFYPGPLLLAPWHGVL